MKLFKILSLLALAALTLSLQFTSSCGGTLTGSKTIDLERPYSFLTGGQPPTSQRADQPLESLNVLTYNTFLRPAPISWGDANQCRAGQIGKELAKRAGELDLVVLNESFAKDAVRKLVDTVGDRFPYQVLRRPRANALRTSGGLSILSRHPIRAVYTGTFDMCAFDDCLATKGFLHAVVELSETLRVNVLATHLDAGDTRQDRTARKNQVAKIRNYMNKHGVGTKWPTLLMGDMNVNGIKKPAKSKEYRSALANLSRKSCDSYSDGGHSPLCGQQAVDVVPAAAEESSWEFNARQTSSLNSKNCAGSSLSSCNSPNKRSNWKKRQRLDYIFAFNSPTSRSGVKLKPRAAKHLPFEDGSCGTNYLSDHQAVQANFDIARPTLVENDERPVEQASDKAAEGIAEAERKSSDDG